MNLGALIDLGVDSGYLARELEKLHLGGYELKIFKAERRGIGGTKVDVILEEKDQAHDHRHSHHRHLQDIRTIIEESTLGERVKKMSLGIFRKLAEAEASVHGTDINEVHFHEVGAVDAIVDIVGAALCLDALEVDRVMASSVELGSGFVTCAHGTLPVPAPATTEILKGIPVKTGTVPFEATTPTGAAILASTVDSFTDRIDFRLLKTGYGLGTRDAEIPNMLRVMLGEVTGSQRLEDDGHTMLVECNIDDMNPEHYEFVMEKLFQAGAHDVYLTPVIMKKTRPAVILSVICSREAVSLVEDIILTETTTLGLRKQGLLRTTLERDVSMAGTAYGEVRIKNTYLRGKKIKSKPEYEDCRRLAEESGVGLREIYEAVERTQCVNRE